MAYATNDINAVRNFVGPAVMYTSDTITTFVLALIFMIGISPMLTFATIIPLPFCAPLCLFVATIPLPPFH